MPKIKIKEIKSIYTNVDENDSSFDLVRASINLRHLKGYAQAEPRHLSQYTVPDLVQWFGQTGWEYETGIYCTLTNDPFAEDSVADKRDVIVLVVKRTIGDGGLRSILFKDLDALTDTWWEPTIEGNMTGAVLERQLLNTTKSGKTFFQVENGRLKIYMPHDCFWLGLIDRDANFNSLDFTGFYCDRLVESFDVDNQYVRVNNITVNEVPPDTNPNDVTCGIGRRLGIKFKVEVLIDENIVLGTSETEMIKDDTSASYYWIQAPTYGAKLYTYEFKFLDDTQIEPPPPANSITWKDGGSAPVDDKYWLFYESVTPGYIVISNRLASKLTPYGTSWSGLGSFLNTHPVVGNLPWGIYGYKILKTDFDTQTWYYIGEEPPVPIADGGFTRADGENYSLVITAVLDDREEIIMGFQEAEIEIDNTIEKYGLKIKDIYVPIDINKRITRIRFYHKLWEGDLDYTLHKEIDLLNNKSSYNNSFILGEYTDSGTTLAQNIAFLFDRDKPSEYKIKPGFRSLITESGISIGLANDDYTRAYYSVLGGGQLQPDIMYDQNLLPISGITKMNAVSTINDRFAVYTDNTMYLITVDQIGGALVFTPTETVALGVKNRLDVASVQGGAIVNTRNGIYLTSGTSQQLLSEPINNLIKLYYSTGQILYNKYKNELYYRPTTTSEDLYRFRFEDNTWERLNVSVYENDPPGDVMSGDALGEWQLTNATDIFIDLNGERAYLEINKLWVYSSGDVTMPEALLVFNKTDLGEPSIDKLFNEFIFDYVGEWALKVYDNNTEVWNTTLTYNSTRELRKFYFPLANRKAFKKCYFKLSTTSSTATLYGFEIDFQILKQRSYA